MSRTARWVWPVWAVLAVLGSLALLWSARARLHSTFDTDARILHRVMSQKLAQQEALIQAVDALERQGVDPGTLSAYVGTLLRPYPQVTAVQRCADLACETLGRAASPLPALPALRPERPTALWPGAGAPLYALALNRVRVWVDASQLVQAEDQPLTPLSFTVYRPASRQVVVQQAAGGLKVGWPGFAVAKNLGTTSQAFPIRIERQVPLAAWPWAAVLGWLGGTGLLAWVLARLLDGRSQARQAAADERARAQGVVLAATEGIIALDGRHRVTLANPAARQVLGHPLPPGVDLREVAVFRSTLSQAPFDSAAFWHSAGPTELPGGLALVRPGGDVQVEGALAPLPDGAGRPGGRVLILREVGPLQRRMLEQLEDGERRIREHEAMLAHVTRLNTLGEMSAGLAHELNQPLTAIVSYGQATARLLADPEPGGELALQAQQAVKAMVTQAQRAAGIIERLRQLVRRTPTQEVAVDLAQAAQNILTLCHADLRALNVTVRTDFPGTPPLVLADPVGLEQVILNLVRNALDALQGAESRELTLRIAPAELGWQLCVHDSGPGLPPEVLPHLFTPFQTTKAQGLGLGLTLSQTLTQGMGGDLSGTNAPGGGAVFTLSLARARLEAADD